MVNGQRRPIDSQFLILIEIEWHKKEYINEEIEKKMVVNTCISIDFNRFQKEIKKRTKNLNVITIDFSLIVFNFVFLKKKEFNSL